MANKKNIYPIPKFKTLEEEDRYWRTHSPLTEGYEGKVQKKKQNRASFLSIRLTGEQLAQLREIATHYGSGPSTYARQLIIQGIESRSHSTLPPSLIVSLYSQMLKGKNREAHLEQLNSIYQQFLEMQEFYVAQMVTLCPLDNLFMPLGEPESQEAEKGIKK